MKENQNKKSTNEEAQAAYERGMKHSYKVDNDIDLDLDSDSEYYVNEDDIKALEEFTEAIRLDPNFTEAYRERVLINIGKKREDQVVNDLTEIIRIEPDDAGAYYSRGITYKTIGQYDKAISDLTEVIRLGLNIYNSIESTQQDDLDRRIWFVGSAYSFRAEVFLNKDQYDKAINDYTMLIKLNPDRYLAYIDRGKVHKKLGQIDLAMEDFMNAHKICSMITRKQTSEDESK